MKWKYFWLFWGGGMALFLVLISSGGVLQTEVAPGGILDHQSAGTAERVNAIQASWAEAGVTGLARWGMIGDLVFIGLYMSGGIIGGRILWQEARSPSLKKLGLFCVLVYFLFGVTDYIETILQLVQLLQDAGSDIMAGIAATVRPIKILSWIAGTIGILIALAWRWRETRA